MPSFNSNDFHFSSMMEKQEKRSITLADITQICSKESEKLIADQADQPPVLQPMCQNCNDSGLGGTSTSSQYARSLSRASRTSRASSTIRVSVWDHIKHLDINDW